MRNIFIVTMLLAAVAFAATSEVITYTNNWGKNSMFNISSTSDAGVDITFSIHKMVVEEMAIDGVPMKTYGIPGIFLPNNEGAPNLAGTGRYIAIPQGAIAKASIIDARTEVYHNIEIAPASNIPKDNDDSPLRYVKDMSIYGKNEYYPDLPVKVSEPMQMRGVDCVVLGITPFQYNPITKDLIVYKDIRVRVDFIGGNGHFGDDALRSIYWEPILQGNLLNYSSLPQVDFYAPERVQARDGFEYIIIVPDDPSFIAWGDTIKAWRKMQGISTQVFTLTQVGGNTSSAIETFLNNAYNTWNPRPVAFLLLSDYPSSGDFYGITSPTYTYAGETVVSDNTYADVNGDNLPDMIQARITAQNESQLSIMINKFLSYERNPYTDPNFYNQPLVAVAWSGGPGADNRWFQLCGEVVRGFFINNLGKNPARQYAIYNGTPTVGCDWSSATNTQTVVNYFSNLGYIPLTNQHDATWWSNGSAAGISAAINSGAFLVQHRDHGALTGWGEPAYSNSNISSLTNDKYTFVNSTNCLTGKYNNSSEVFVEAFHRSQHGALGCNAPSEVSYSFVNDAYIWGWYDCMWQQFMPDYPAADITPYGTLLPSTAMQYGKYFLNSSSWPYIPQYNNLTFHLFHHHGDAFNPLYSEVPQALTVVHLPNLMAGVSSFTVTANDSAIIALTVNGEIIGVARATGNPVAITITPQIPGSNMIITVTKQNYYRYQVTVPVVSSSYPYIVASSTVVNDSGANNQVNPGERIDYGVWAKNIGIGTAQNIYGKLSTADTFTTLVTDSSWYGTIAADDSVYSDPVYRFRVSRNTPNNHLINFTFTFKDNHDSTFRSFKSVRVYAPIISYQSVAVVGGNNNGIFNRGETVNIVVTLKNEGGADAENVSATLLTTAPLITIIDNQGSFGTIAPDSTANNSTDPFTVTSDSSIIPGTMVQFRVAVNHSFYTDTFQFSLPVEIYLEDFEATNGSYVPNPATGAWEWGVPTSGPDTAHSGTKVWATVLGGNYTNSANWTLTTPELTASGDNPQLKFWHWYNMEQGASGTIYDGGNVKISINNASFTVVTPDSGYTGTCDASTPGVGGQPVFSGINEIWTEVTFNLSVNSGQRFKIRWHFGSDVGVVRSGWYIDDVTGIGFTNLLSNIDEGLEPINQLTTALNAPKPNPVTNGLARISFSIAQPSKVALKIYDASGRLVRTLVNSQFERGVYNLVWNGKDENNRAVAEGIYFYTLETPKQKFTRKMVYTK